MVLSAQRLRTKKVITFYSRGGGTTKCSYKELSAKKYRLKGKLNDYMCHFTFSHANKLATSFEAQSANGLCFLNYLY